MAWTTPSATASCPTWGPSGPRSTPTERAHGLERRSAWAPGAGYPQVHATPAHDQEGRARRGPEPMNLRRTIRGPITWLIVAVVLVLALLTITTSSGGYKSVSLSTIETAIANQQVASATLQDKEQQIQVTLKQGTEVEKASKLQSSYTIHYDDTL